MKKLTLIFLTFILLSCNHQKNEITVKLDSENGNGVFRYGKAVIWPSNLKIDYQGVPSNLKEFVVRSYPLQTDQYYFNLYKSGKLDKTQFQNYSAYYNIDTAKLTTDLIDCEVLILVGTAQNNKRIIIVDSDNNNDFNGEKILEYDYPVSIERQKQLDSIIPLVRVKYDYYINGKKISKNTIIKPSPYPGSLQLTFSTKNEIEKNFYLFVGIPEYKKGKFKVDKTHYDFYVSNSFTTTTFTNKNTSIFINDQNSKIPSQLNGDIPYQIGDIFNAKGKDYLIQSISIWGNALKLKYLGENTHPTGFSEGYFIPKFHAKKLDNSVFMLDQYPDKYILFDFWGTWCDPCLKIIPELKKINQDFSNKNLVLVSIAFDRDLNKVKDFVTNENMDWIHVFVDQSKTEKNSLVEILKITSFPSTILIAPNGEIIARNKDLNELREILSKRTSSL